MYKLHHSHGHKYPFLDITSLYQGARKKTDKDVKKKRCMPDESVTFYEGT